MVIRVENRRNDETIHRMQDTIDRQSRDHHELQRQLRMLRSQNHLLTNNLREMTKQGEFIRRNFYTGQQARRGHLDRHNRDSSHDRNESKSTRKRQKPQHQNGGQPSPVSQEGNDKELSQARGGSAAIVTSSSSSSSSNSSNVMDQCM
jgi:predicted ribosome quality control (RQC) complex YloA/Tae2 family protein